MKEVIIITNNLADDGAARVLSELATEWINNGLKVSVFQIRSEYFEDSYDISDKVEIKNIKAGTKNRFFRRIIQAREVIRILETRKNATILAFLNPAYLLVGICKPFIKNRIVFSERNDPSKSPAQRRYRIIRDILFLLADICVFQTTTAKEHFLKAVQKKSVIIPNPINNNLPSIYNGPRRKVIVAACRLNQQKNIPMMIYAFKKLYMDYPEYSLEIYGRGELEGQLLKLISSLGLDDKVFLKGFSYHLYDQIYDATMYVSSSNYEGISNSMLEALGMGIPVVCTDTPCGGERMYIKNGDNGYLVPIGNVDAMYHAMAKVIEGQIPDDKLVKNANKLREELSIDLIAKKWMDIF